MTKNNMPHPKANKENWEKEFFTRFGANKIWVNPSKENVETILEIWSFINESFSTLLAQQKQEMCEKIENEHKLAHTDWQQDDIFLDGYKEGLKKVLEIISNHK